MSRKRGNRYYSGLKKLLDFCDNNSPLNNAQIFSPNPNCSKVSSLINEWIASRFSVYEILTAMDLAINRYGLQIACMISLKKERRVSVLT